MGNEDFTASDINFTIFVGVLIGVAIGLYLFV
jgi:hypothetical protein